MSNATFPDSSFKTSPVAAIRSVFDSPNWVQNVLWMTLAACVPFVGVMCLLGWGARQIRMRAGRPEVPVPDIDSSQMGDYLTKGIWPFCVYFIVNMLGSILIAVPFVLLMAAGMATLGEDGAPFVVLAIIPLSIVASFALMAVIVPLLIRSMVCQDLGGAFDFAWMRQFWGLMFWEVCISGFVFWMLSLVVLLVGFAMCFVGYLPAIGILSGASMNLLAQWYEVFLARGGDPVPAPLDDIIEATIV